MSYRFLQSHRFIKLDLSKQSIVDTPLDAANLTTSTDFARYFLRQVYIRRNPVTGWNATRCVVNFIDGDLVDGFSASYIKRILFSVLDILENRSIPDLDKFLLKLFRQNHVVSSILQMEYNTMEMERHPSPSTIFDQLWSLQSDLKNLGPEGFHQDEIIRHDTEFQVKPEYHREFIEGCIMAIWQDAEFMQQDYVMDVPGFGRLL